MSLQVNELRIGNILREGVVRSIASNGVVEIEKGGIKTPRKIEELNPEPLTEDWMEKKGFELVDNYNPEKRECSWGIKNDRFDDKYDVRLIQIQDYQDIYVNHLYAGECKYAHTLQNAIFALTGEEL